MQHRNSFFGVLLAMLLPGAVAAPVCAQDDEAGEVHDHADESSAAEDQEVPPGAAADEAPESFDSLLEEFRELTGKIDDSAGLPTSHLEDIRSLRERVTRFNEQRVASELSAAVEIQLVLWASDFSPARDAAFARLDGIEITSSGLRVLWAQHLKERMYRYEKAIEVLDAGEVDLEAHPIAAVIRAEALIPQNRFDDAQAALESIPTGARVRPDLLDRMYYLRQQIEELQENWQDEAALRDAEASADDLPRATFETSRGTIVMELYENEAPNTVANFITLVEQGFYNGLSFYQVVPNTFVAAGDPAVRADLVTSPDKARLQYTLPLELPRLDNVAGEDDALDAEPIETMEDAPPAGDAAPAEQEEAEVIPLPEKSRSHFAGVLSMERSGEAIDSSRFIITLRQRLDRDGRNVAFGRVIEGMATARELTSDDQIISASILRKRDHDYAPVTIPAPVEPQPPADAGTADSIEEAPTTGVGDDAGAGDATSDDDGETGDDTGEDDGDRELSDTSDPGGA